jgi:hypothetical protein
MPSTTIQFFAFAHLPEHLQTVSRPIGELATKLEAELPDGPEKSAGMRKLLEAKDCFVRAALALAPVPRLTTFQDRVRKEHADLNDNIGRLARFIGDDASFMSLPLAERERLITQHQKMVEYSDALDARIAHFKD